MDKQVQYAGSTVFYRVTGKGQPVMLVHGFGEYSQVWDQQARFLENHVQLIIPDLPGSGKSAMVPDMSMEGLAEVLHTIIHEENIQSCVMIAHSMGGYISLAFADLYPNHLHGLGLFHSTAFADTPEKKDTRRKGIAFIEEHGAFAFLKSTTPNLFSPRSRDEMPGLIDKQTALLDNFSPAALVSYYNSMMNRADHTDILRKTADPVLFIAGHADGAVPLEDVLKQCHLPEKSYFHSLPYSGHMGMLEEPEKSNAILREFLSATGPFRF